MGFDQIIWMRENTCSSILSNRIRKLVHLLLLLLFILLLANKSYMTVEIQSQRCLLWILMTEEAKHDTLVFPVCQLLHGSGKIFLTLNTLHPLGVNLHPLNALLQGSSYGWVRVCFEELVYFLNLLKWSKLQEKITRKGQRGNKKKEIKRQ